MKYGLRLHADVVITLKIMYIKQVNLTVCVSFFLGCVNGAQRVCVRLVAILHIETFVTFGFDPFPILKVITD